MTELKKGSYLATLQRLDELLVPGNENLLASELHVHLKNLDKLLKLISLVNIVEKNREELKNSLVALKLKKLALNTLAKGLNSRLKDLQSQANTNLFNTTGSRVNVHRTVEHHSIVLPFISVPMDYRITDQFLPWSFGTNKAELFEIETSSLNYKYKQNRNYKKLSVPNVVYLNHSEKNISKFEGIGGFAARLKVNNFLYIQASVSGAEADQIGANQIKPFVLFTIDGSDPSRFNHAEGSADLIYIPKSCTLKLRAYKPGYIESNMLVLEIDVETRKEDTIKFALESMVRPEFEASDHNTMDINDDGLSDIDDDIFANENFASWHDYGTYATPKD